MNDQNENQNENPETQKPDAVKPADAMSEDELLDALEQQADEAINLGEFDETVEAGGFANPMEALAAENTAQEAKISELNDQNLRLVAEMENLRRRTQKDVADARNFSISSFARDMLGVSDNLRRAIEHVDEADKDHAGLKTLIEGVELTERELLKAMEKNGVKKISPLNEKFDPNFHQAMFEVPNTEVNNNTVVQVVQDGYIIGERVLRPAMVGVAKGGPKAGAAAQPDDGSTSA